MAGAVAGGVIRRGKNRRAARAQNEANAAAVTGSQAAFDQARAACLTGAEGIALGGAPLRFGTLDTPYDF